MTTSEARPVCDECAVDEDPRPWCDCRDDEQCKGPCRQRAHDPGRCPRYPRGARTIAKAAERAGWAAWTKVDRGVDAMLREPREIECVALRLSRGQARAVAIWHDGKFSTAFVYGEHPMRRVNATQLRAAIAGTLEPAPPPVEPPLPPRQPSIPAPVTTLAPAANSWATVHIGDVVRGADQRPWEVVARHAGLRWAVDGDHATFTLRQSDREIETDRRLADLVEIVSRADHTEAATAVGALLGAGVRIEVIEESPTMPDPFAAPAAPAGPVEPEFDGYGRYLLPDPETGKERAFTRVSTIAGTIADKYNLTRWEMRMVAKGVAIRPDLIAGAVAADPEDDKSDLNSIAKQAKDAAEASAGANFGTALHTFTRRLDAGESLASLRAPAPLDADLAAYAERLKAAHLRVTHSEQIVVLPDLGVAGRFDRIVEQPPGVTKSEPNSILDLKSGKSMEFGQLEIAIQQALYARAPLMYDVRTRTYSQKPAVDLDRGLIMHLPVGKANAQVYGVNIARGWAFVELAMNVRAARRESKRLMWLVTPDDPATVALHLVANAADQAELAQLWERLHPRGLWSEGVNAAAMARHAALNAQTVNV